MPPPRKSSPRRKDSRRSRSYSPRPSQTKRRSRSRSRSPKDRRRSRSRSPARKRSPPPQRRQRSPKHYSPPRKVSRSPQRKRSPSPVERNYPVKRQADSSGKRQGYRSKSPSPAPVKRSKDDRYYPDDSPEEKRYASSHRQKSPSPRRESPSQYGGKMYADQPSTSKRPLFPAGKKPDEIESVKIVDKAKKQKLDKRFQTLEQLAQGHFDFEENITIGIHRGPSHMELDNDIPVNYEFNSKTFLMIFPKKDYVKAIFDRDEIKAFHHDDILDEEAYTEKRTITVKPTDKPKPSRYPEQTDYKITIGGDREGYGDKRMVQDAGSRTRMSRPGYPEADVKVRLDPRPDPRYEKLYREQQRQEDQSLMQEKIHRNPNDLRYNLMKRNTSGDRGDRERERGRDMGMVDARSKIEARRQESHSDDRRDRPRDSRGSRDSPPPSRSFGGEKKNPVKTDLPDFKNRPGAPLQNPDIWIIGSSVIKDLAKFADGCLDQDLGTQLANVAASVKYHGEMNMKIADLLPAVKYMLKTNQPPQMIVFQCGEHDVCVGRNTDTYDVMKQDLATMKQEIPGALLVWSQMLPPWMCRQFNGSSLAKSRRRINRFMMKCFCSEEIGGGFIYHPQMRTDLRNRFQKLNAPMDGNLHLTEDGMKTYVTQLKAGIKYLISGEGLIFPYLKWPPDNMQDLMPESMCMLNKEHIQSMTAKKIQELSKEQIQQLSIDQIGMFSRNQLEFVFCGYFIQSLSKDQITELRAEHFKYFKLEQISLFTPCQVSWFKKEVQDLIKKREKKEEKKNMKKAMRVRSKSGESSADISMSRELGRNDRSKSGERSRGRRDRSRSREHGRSERSRSRERGRSDRSRSREWGRSERSRSRERGRKYRSVSRDRDRNHRSRERDLASHGGPPVCGPWGHGPPPFPMPAYVPPTGYHPGPYPAPPGLYPMPAPGQYHPNPGSWPEPQMQILPTKPPENWGEGTGPEIVPVNQSNLKPLQQVVDVSDSESEKSIPPGISAAEWGY